MGRGLRWGRCWRARERPGERERVHLKWGHLVKEPGEAWVGIWAWPGRWLGRGLAGLGWGLLTSALVVVEAGADSEWSGFYPLGRVLDRLVRLGY